jgi:hypothetical protein
MSTKERKKVAKKERKTTTTNCKLFSGRDKIQIPTKRK